ncbi:MAG: aldehyde dehydrogenase family protein, partial [Chloroflexota bacterium]
YFNFTIPEPTGVVGVVAPDRPELLGLVQRLAPALCGGNTVVAIASETRPLGALTLAEVLATSDLPGGVVNVLSGKRSEMLPWLAAHMDVNAVDAAGCSDEELAAVEAAAADNVKRVVRLREKDLMSPFAVTSLMEFKTVWHPIGV